ncbi:MAG TPA: hypothetical protein P5528_03960 [Steroidobacteraceae bacterium]|nr:hypothetical protein [Steroidobacteraceae bacterium]
MAVTAWRVWMLGALAFGFQVARDHLVVFLWAYRNVAPPWADSPNIAWLGNPSMAGCYLGLIVGLGLVGQMGCTRGHSIVGLSRPTTRPAMMWWLLLGPFVIAFALWSAMLIVAGAFEQLPSAICLFLFSLLWLVGKQPADELQKTTNESALG